MQKVPLYFDDKKKRHYVLNSYVGACDRCGFAGILLIAIADYSKGKQDIGFFCRECAEKINPLGSQTQKVIVIVTDKIPITARPFFLDNAGLVNSSNLSTFDISSIEERGGVTKDNTKYAGRESLEGAQIGLDPKELIEERKVKDILLIEGGK